MKWFDNTALTLVIIGALNWLLVGIFKLDIASNPVPVSAQNEHPAPEIRFGHVTGRFTGNLYTFSPYLFFKYFEYG